MTPENTTVPELQDRCAGENSQAGFDSRPPAPPWLLAFLALVGAAPRSPRPALWIQLQTSTRYLSA